MARFSTIWLTYLAIVSAPGASAWTVLWRNDTTPAELIDGQSERGCTQIWHQEGEEFSFDPEGPWCIKFYSDAECDSIVGIGCEGRMWKQEASQNLSAFNVYPMPPASRTAYGFTSSTPTPTSTTTETPTPTSDGAEETPASEAGSDDSGLSGGAIAGVVIGVLVAVALLCAAFFYLGRRTGRNAAATAAAAAAPAESAPPPSNPPPPPPQSNISTDPISPSGPPSTSPTVYAPPPVAAELPKPPMVETVPQYSPPTTYNQPPNGLRMVELPSQHHGAELSNTQQVQELEGRGMDKFGPYSGS